MKWQCLQYGIDVTYLVPYYKNGPEFEEDELIEVNYGIYTTLLSKVNLYKRLGKDKHCTSITFENYTKLCYEDQFALHIGLENERAWDGLKLSTCDICSSCKLGEMKNKKRY